MPITSDAKQVRKTKRHIKENKIIPNNLSYSLIYLTTPKTEIANAIKEIKEKNELVTIDSILIFRIPYAYKTVLHAYRTLKSLSNFRNYTLLLLTQQGG